jgi:homopolymeric O-antigen transport system permease protein
MEQLTTRAPAEPEQRSLPPAATATLRLERTHGIRRVLDVSDLWHFREVALQIAKRDVTVRYRQTFLGAAWAILQPLATMVVFALFFGRLAHVKSEGHSYPMFSLTGLVAWTFFSNALLLGSDSLVANPQLISRIYFPRIFIPAGVLAAGIVDLAIALVLTLVVVTVTGNGPPLAIVALPALIVILVAVSLGMASMLGALNVHYRDVKYIVPFVTQFWLFATPVAYPVTIVPEPWRTLWAINPMVGVVEGFRWAMLSATHPPWALIGISTCSASIILVAGLAYFHAAERTFADVL